VVSLADYIGRMSEGQETIWFLVADSIEAAQTSPQLEGFRARGIEVLLMADPIDAFWPDRLDAFEGKSLKSITQATDADLPRADDDAEAVDVATLIAALKTALGADVADVRATHRLTDSACVLAAASGGPDLQMQRLLRRAGRAGPGLGSAPVLEINPRHAVIRALATKVEATQAIADAAETLLDLARIQDGDPPRDASLFARRITAMLAGAA